MPCPRMHARPHARRVGAVRPVLRAAAARSQVTPAIETSSKAMGKLRKEAERVKDILSANTMYKVTLSPTPHP